MIEPIDETKEFSEKDIETIIYALNQLGAALLKMNAVVSKIPPEAASAYIAELNSLTSLFQDRCRKLKVILDGQFKKEKEENLPANFAFRKVYKTLKTI